MLELCNVMVLQNRSALSGCISHHDPAVNHFAIPTRAKWKLVRTFADSENCPGSCCASAQLALGYLEASDHDDHGEK